MAGPGDVNGDGMADIALTAPFGGRIYVVFGKADTLPVDLHDFEEGGSKPPQMAAAGYRIDTPATDLGGFTSIGAAGDVNGDGIPDLVIGIVGRRGSDDSWIRHSCACVVFGKADDSPVKLRRLGDQGFKIKGPSTYWDAAGAGDVNGDGLDDVIVGAPNTRHCCGKAYVVFGKASSRDVKVWKLGKDGYRITGGPGDAIVGNAVTGVGDIDGDGKDDALVGAPGSRRIDGKDGTAKGIGYVLYGAKAGSSLKLSKLGNRGYRLIGSRHGDGVGGTVASAGDVNGDGIPDVVVGSNTGHIYLVFGRR